ncbi:hypothetical protein JCM10003_1405 [Bacteroides pyogenes JCM 10003]|nr:hypothetical protein JCM10003_1405 [Bacteroides pyogenes JCM 10003]
MLCFQKKVFILARTKTNKICYEKRKDSFGISLERDIEDYFMGGYQHAYRFGELVCR